MTKRMIVQYIIGSFFAIWVIFSQSALPQIVQNLMLVGGFCLIMVGVLGRLYATLYIGGMKNRGSDGNSFVKEGVYGICRNPLYLFSFIGFIGLLLIKAQLSFLIVGIIAYLLAYRVTIRDEETYLEGLYGESYRQFLKDVPRFFPDTRIKNFTYPQKLTILVHFYHVEMKRALVWVGMGALIYIISLLHTQGILPYFISVL
ncbi:isoprenylcysteine carboxylmethyltransferase family protein [Helicobacter cholecystus]|uniref:Isoprenylcysteine carboxylmethyltransferase family protein n=1 Tax=Helicobacter cholecystus TaxID=45498 RepID=A0A3D8IX31_9HELI|nr:isoprenylcysteine carboxylmethyltransferase family protein [Helicobacter cholecystus]RDU69839.1 isoprenylcysteine carboxylmethyltransferase family protein [Helicobacter cholecystus]VEJ25819.1 protein-S-isoprenylcysteine methyltransferase [Helicobacter cholecystus]